MTSTYFICRNEDCEFYNKKELQTRLKIAITDEGDTVYKDTVCKCGKDREVIEEGIVSGFTTNMIGKNIGKG